MMPKEEASMAKLSEGRFYNSLDRLKGYWQCLLVPDAQETFTIATPGGLYTPARVPLGNFKHTSSKRRLHACWRGSIAWSGWTM